MKKRINRIGWMTDSKGQARIHVHLYPEEITLSSGRTTRGRPQGASGSADLPDPDHIERVPKASVRVYPVADTKPAILGMLSQKFVQHCEWSLFLDSAGYGVEWDDEILDRNQHRAEQERLRTHIRQDAKSLATWFAASQQHILQLASALAHTDFAAAAMRDESLIEEEYYTFPVASNSFRAALVISAGMAREMSETFELLRQLVSDTPVPADERFDPYFALVAALRAAIQRCRCVTAHMERLFTLAA